MENELLATGMELGAALILISAVLVFFTGIHAATKHERQERERIKKPCLGCDAGHAIRDDLHLDNYGQPYMLCQRAGAVIKTPANTHRHEQSSTAKRTTAKTLQKTQRAAVLPGPGHMGQ